MRPAVKHEYEHTGIGTSHIDHLNANNTDEKLSEIKLSLFIVPRYVLANDYVKYAIPEP